jgi:hypothetical protein
LRAASPAALGVAVIVRTPALAAHRTATTKTVVNTPGLPSITIPHIKCVCGTAILAVA